MTKTKTQQQQPPSSTASTTTTLPTTTTTAAAASQQTTTTTTSPSKPPPFPSHHHHSRLTRFLSKFTSSSIHSRRKSSLPNLNNQQQQNTSQRSLSHHLPNSDDINSTIKINSISLQPLLPLHTIADRRSSSFDQIRHLHNHSDDDDGDGATATTDVEDGADPNASMRPLTPSSKAVSMISPIDARTPITDLSSIDPTEQDSPTYSRDSERPYSRRHKPSSNSSCSSEPDDCKSTFGNSSLASTKPTTVISVENPPGNRIAQPRHSTIIHSTMAQPSLNLRNRVILVHQRVRSASSTLAFSAPNPNTTTTTAVTPTLTVLSSPPISPQNHISIVNVPSHSLPHPSQNPHPAALADNASILTLASSGFSPSLHNNQNFQSDEDASVRALAPSRRESVESLSSRWSNVKSNRSTRTTGTGTHFFTGISPTLNPGDPQPSSSLINPLDNSSSSPDGPGTKNHPQHHLQSEDLADNLLHASGNDALDLNPSRDVPSIALVNG